LFEVRERVDPLLLVAVDPALGDVVDRSGVQVVQLLAPPPHRGHEVGRLEQGKVLAHGLTGHVHVRAQLAQRLAIAGVQAVEQPPAARVRQRPEYPVHRLSVEMRSHLTA